MYIIHYPNNLDIQNYLGSLYNLCSKDSLDIHIEIIIWAVRKSDRWHWGS
jgi:hypothetical protein